MDPSKRLESLEKKFLKEWTHRHPLLGTALGLHDDHDERMPDGSIEREHDDARFLRRWLGEFQKIDVRKLTPARAVDRDLAIHALRNWLFDREELRFWESSPEAPRVIGQSIFQVLSRNYAPLGHRMRAIMKRLERMPKYIDQSRSKLRAPCKLFVEIELETITRLPGFFNTLKDIGREHMPPTPQRELNRLIDHAQNALERYSDWLIVDVLPDCRDEYAIGEEKFRRLLHVRGVTASPGQLLGLAEVELERARERLREVARGIRRKVPIEDVRDMIRQQHPENFDGVLRHVRDSVGKSRQFVQRARFCSLPEGEQIYVIETPSFLRHVLPFGGYWGPARFEGRLDGYVFATPGDCDSDKLKEHNYTAIAQLSLHQAYPGRHLQMAWASRHRCLWRTLYEDPATTAGWSHYAEERVREMGFDDAPPALFWLQMANLLNATRILIDVRLAQGKLTYTQTVEMLIDHLGMDRVCAESEARRYVTTPGAQAIPLWAKEQVHEIRKTVREKMKGRYTDSFFNTSFLRAGPLPLPLLRRELELKAAEELSKPPEKPGEEPRKEERKHHPPAPSKAKAPALTRRR
jgi:uncharacterized protein (DUF885 family)